MYKIFGFPIYSLKKSLFSEINLQALQYFRPNLKKLADHKQEKTAMTYAEAGEEARIKILKDKLKVPNLTIEPITRN